MLPNLRIAYFHVAQLKNSLVLQCSACCTTLLTSVKPGLLLHMSLIMVSATGLATLCLRVRCFFRFILDSKTSLPFFRHSWGKKKNSGKMSNYV